jgi:hypothetical protein
MAYYTIHPLAGGWIFATALKTVLSHWALHGPPNRFEWDRSAFREVFDFGTWVFLSSTFSFLLTSGDRILPGLLPRRERDGAVLYRHPAGRRPASRRAFRRPADPSGGQIDPMSTDIGVVVIGRNEGERLRRCLASLRASGCTAVYVDSGSTDGSPDAARELEADVLALDMSVPFTAARARNAGFARLLELAPNVRLV